ncbi:MAG: PAS domain S-box protein [Desulfobulbaceae bacterium]|nr:PAS domain S-box protein [Desulfobulbaceae bacterium]
MNSISPEYRERFNQELKELLHRRAFAILCVGAILIPLFSLLDFVAVNKHFELFLVWRITVALFFIFLIMLNFLDKSCLYPLAIVTSGYFVVSGIIAAMIVKTGGYSSFYYVGFVVVFVTYAAIFPLTTRQTTLFGIALYAFYSLPIFLFSTFSSSGFRDFLSNSFFLATFIVIIIVKSRAETKSRINEFNLRMKEEEIVNKLGFYAEKLENEVKKRTLELKESENHYRDLYENIIDDVLLVDLEGKILLGNARFYQNFKVQDDIDQENSFLDFLHPDDRESARQSLMARLQEGENVTGFQFRLLNVKGKSVDVECNATAIRKEGVVVGFQMLLRDISTHKVLEQKLLHSLKTVKDTRSATILGLAKLSEYRDSNTGNHLERIREYCMIIARRMAATEKYAPLISEQFIEDLYHSSILHDIGKVGIPDDILLKKMELTPEETEIIKQHTAHGGKILKAVDMQTAGHSFLSMAKSVAYFHHEKWDGSGYPYGLREEEIPLSARIVALADTYEELTTMNRYRSPHPHDDAVKIIVQEKGRHFSPDVVDAFLEKQDSFDIVRHNYTSSLHEDDTRISPECYKTRRKHQLIHSPDFVDGKI